MKGTNRLRTPMAFSENLYEEMIRLESGIRRMALFEFRYALENLYPPGGWDSVELDPKDRIEGMISQRAFFESIEPKPRKGDRIVLDENIARLTRMLLAGLLQGKYGFSWIKSRFYFDIRGFYFLPRTIYFTDAVLAHFGGKASRNFEKRQKRFEESQDIGYLDFEDANEEIDQAFIKILQKLILTRKTPILITIAGPTAAGKTEVTERLMNSFEDMGKSMTTIEMDNFLLDRDYRDNKPMGSQTIHFELFKSSLKDILQGRSITIPSYDFITATSSHDFTGQLKPGCNSLEVHPADLVFLEGNFPFHMEELSDLIGIKIVYLTDDPVRLKRKWKRDIDYRKNYDPAHFRNRFFKTQFLRAEDVYRPLMEKCDMVVDTTGAAIWLTPELEEELGKR
jgi:uridine kinase